MKRAVTMAAVSLLFLLACPQAAQALPVAWEVEYYSSSGLYPEQTGQGWTYYNNAPSALFRGWQDGYLWIDTMAQPFRALGWRNLNGTFDFESGFALEASLKMIRNTDSYASWGGGHISIAQNTGLYVEFDTDQVSLYRYPSSISTWPMDTSDAFHTYRIEVVGGDARLFVDGLERASLPDAISDFGSVWLGDQGWEGGEILWDYVRYGTVIPEPATFLLLGLGLGGIAFIKRRGHRNR